MQLGAHLLAPRNKSVGKASQLFGFWQSGLYTLMHDELGRHCPAVFSGSDAEALPGFVVRKELVRTSKAVACGRSCAPTCAELYDEASSPAGGAYRCLTAGDGSTDMINTFDQSMGELTTLPDTLVAHTHTPRTG